MSLSVQEGYDQWAHSYDAVVNRTRDLDKKATQSILSSCPFFHVLELGCGTGKNTLWLAQQAQTVMALDFSLAMLEKAREKVKNANVQFKQADITQPWPFEKASFDLVTCNLVLEHIQDLEFVFREAGRVLQPGGLFFICELHPAKQYGGSKARFEKEKEIQVLDCFVHHTSGFFNGALHQGFQCRRLDEWFDEDSKDTPRLISFLFQKSI